MEYLHFYLIYLHFCIVDYCNCCRVVMEGESERENNEKG